MEVTFTHFIILGVVSGLTKGAGVLPDGPLSAAVGESVMFTTTFTPTNEPLFSVSWKFGDKDITSLTNVNKTAPEYEGRITLFIYTGSLELRNVALNDSGEYTVSYFSSGGDSDAGKTRMNMYDNSQPISGCSSGFIARAVIPSLVVVGTAIGGACYIYAKKKANNAPPPKSRKEQEETEHENSSVVYDNI